MGLDVERGLNRIERRKMRGKYKDASRSGARHRRGLI